MRLFLFPVNSTLATSFNTSETKSERHWSVDALNFVQIQPLDASSPPPADAGTNSDFLFGFAFTVSTPVGTSSSAKKMGFFTFLLAIGPQASFLTLSFSFWLANSFVIRLLPYTNPRGYSSRRNFFSSHGATCRCNCKWCDELEPGANILSVTYRRCEMAMVYLLFWLICWLFHDWFSNTSIPFLRSVLQVEPKIPDDEDFFKEENTIKQQVREGTGFVDLTWSRKDIS
ncbi:hypothetical protein RHMOL_Rhmol05G0005700 [Rhododendron molle]|uniref:Uncharacterized protein n=1 Tax=Rhododendron molle TaxID=49168 RepID=A0ACC0NL72_RHOML|nr:hypothetical protein RHMOL_Rhmol05G0005700 [Rhododendron molle]